MKYISLTWTGIRRKRSRSILIFAQVLSQLQSSPGVIAATFRLQFNPREYQRFASGNVRAAHHPY